MHTSRPSKASLVHNICESRGSLPWNRRDLCAAGAIGLGVFIALYPLWRPGIPSRWDFLMGMYRAFELDRSWYGRVLFPRWGMDWNFTYGAPLFEFYAPLASYITLVFHYLGQGWIEAAKATFAASLLLGGLGTFAYARWLLADRRAALASALAYLLAPYLLVCIYQRGTGAEALALGLLPWLFWAAHRTVVEPEGRGWMLISAALTALMMLSHNITALFSIPLVAVYAGLLAWHEGAGRRMWAYALALALGLGISAFFWIPALAEQRYTQVEGLMSSPDALRGQLTTLADLVGTRLDYVYWGDVHVRVALWQVILGALALLTLIYQDRPARYTMGLLAASAALMLGLQLNGAFPFWGSVPLVRFIQFPWRLLGIASFGIALLIGSALTLRRLAGAPGWVVFGCCLGIMVFGSLRNLDPKRSPLWFPLDSSQVSLGDLYDRVRRDDNGLGLFTDYMPRWMTAPARELALPRAKGDLPTSPAGYVPQIEIVEESPGKLDCRVRADLPFRLLLHRFYYPGWQISVDGRTMEVRPGTTLGLVEANLPAGSYRLTVEFGETPLRRAVDALAVASLLIWVVLMARSPSTRKVLVGLGIVLVLVVALTLRHQGLGDPPRHPVAAPANFEDRVRLVAYSLPRSTWHAGDVLPLRLYWLAERSLSEDLTVFVHVVRAPDGDRIAQHDAQPIMGVGPTSRWDANELVTDEHAIRLSPDCPPGTYQVLVGLFRSDPPQNLTVTGAGQVLPGDRVVLGEIQVAGK